MSSGGSLERFGKKDPWFHKVKIVQTLNEWTLVYLIFPSVYTNKIQVIRHAEKKSYCIRLFENFINYTTNVF